MFETTSNAHGGFTPAAVAPQNAITPEKVIYHLHEDRGCKVKTGTVPYFSNLCFISLPDKGNSPKAA